MGSRLTSETLYHIYYVQKVVLFVHCGEECHVSPSLFLQVLHQGMLHISNVHLSSSLLTSYVLDIFLWLIKLQARSTYDAFCIRCSERKT